MAINYQLERRLMHWAAWTIYNFSGWPEESPMYKFMQEGFLGNKNNIRKSSIPFKPNDIAEKVHAIILRLNKKSHEQAEAIYVYYVTGDNIREFSKEKNINYSTFYRRLREAKRWIGERLKCD